jgi:hypothetical protein
MSTEQLEQRLAAIEKTLAELQQRVEALVNAAPPKVWPPPAPPPMTPEQEQAFKDAMAYGRYYRQTGKDPPPDWKPWDPIPDPDPEWLS